MTSMSLQDWLKCGWLKEHKISRQEIADLFAVADRDLQTCQTPDLVPDWRFKIAYNAALQLATAALAASGYQAERGNHQPKVRIDFREPFTHNQLMGKRRLPPEVREYFSKLGKKGGLKGGLARAAKMSAEERSASARMAVQARWAKLKTASQ